VYRITEILAKPIDITSLWNRTCRKRLQATSDVFLHTVAVFPGLKVQIICLCAEDKHSDWTQVWWFVPGIGSANVDCWPRCGGPWKRMLIYARQIISQSLRRTDEGGGRLNRSEWTNCRDVTVQIRRHPAFLLPYVMPSDFGAGTSSGLILISLFPISNWKFVLDIICYHSETRSLAVIENTHLKRLEIKWE